MPGVGDFGVNRELGDQKCDSGDCRTERTQYRLIHKQLIDMYQTHHYHYERGIIDDDLWQTWVAQLDDGLRRTPQFGRDRFPRLKFLRPTFRAFLEGRLRHHGIEPGEEVGK